MKKSVKTLADDQNSFFRALDRGTLGSLPGLIVWVNATPTSPQELFDAFGEQIYGGEHAALNPIFEGSRYFGQGFDSFSECLFVAPHARRTPLLIVHRSLPSLSAPDLKTYVETLRHVAEELPATGAGERNGVSVYTLIPDE